MKHIHIENIGPVKVADFDLKRFNVIIGPQSSGKSCILKIASYCTWVEKHIEMAQSAEEFRKENYFIERLVSFHKLHNYLDATSIIRYETQYMQFEYTEDKGFIFKWKNSRWNYRRPKISYIPAERNLVSVLTDWMNISMKRNNISDFMSDWNIARNYEHDLRILNLGITYHYDYNRNADTIMTKDGKPVDLTNASSGLQSIIPLLVYLRYISKDIYTEEARGNFKERSQNEELPLTIYNILIKEKNKAPQESDVIDVSSGMPSFIFKKIGSFNFKFKNDKDASRIETIYKNFSNTHNSVAFIEEPEENLFPPTQKRLIQWIIDNSQTTSYTIATHSPYVLTAFLEQKDLKDFNLLFIPNIEEQSVLKTATEETLQEIYDYGVDAFFNIQSLQD